MTRGKEAVIIDYKFGEENSAYNRQISEYMKIVQQMGYERIKGYIWYVSLGKIVPIEK